MKTSEMNAKIEKQEAFITRIAESFEAGDLGAPFKVVLNNAVKVKFDAFSGKEICYSIPDVDGLLRAVVISRILHPRRLLGRDLKFVRRVLGFTQKALAPKIELSMEHLSRCESGNTGMSSGSEKLLRIFAMKEILKVHKMKACDERTVLENALDKLFDRMKPEFLFDVNDELEFHFHRSRIHPDGEDLGNKEDEDQQWDPAEEALAA